jgi:uncharacterized membrane protein required for colicin V production
MIAAVTSVKMPFNWFDVAVVFVLAFGYWRGRKNGMSKELLPLFYWLITVIVAGFGYPYVGDYFIQQGIAKKLASFSDLKEKTAAYVWAYLLIVVVVRGFYSLAKKLFKKRLEGSNLFGSSEYYLGMVSGVIRYGCIIVSVLALANAPVYTAADLEAQRIYNNRWFGGGMEGYSGNFIPAMSEFQELVFKDSLTGPTLKNGAGVLLINTGGAPASAKPRVMEIK